MDAEQTQVTLIDRAEIVNGLAVVEYKKTEAELAALRHRFAGVVFDMTSTKGDKEARSARLELVSLRTALEKRRKEFKAPALELGRKIDAEAARVTGEIAAVEEPIDQQIKADENRRAAEKAERERIEAERIAGHQQRLTAMRSCVARAQGLPSARIANGIAQVEAIDLSPSVWEEFAAEAAAAKDVTLTAMRLMFDTAKAREDEDARVEAQRVENERIAAENRAAAERLAEQQRALDAQAAALKAEQDAIDTRKAEEAAKLQREADEREAEAKRIADAAEAQRVADEAEAKKKADALIAAVATPAPVLSEKPVADANARAFVDAVEAKGAATMAARVSPATPNDSGARLTLGQINERLEVVSVNTEQLARMGFTATVNRSARTYLESDFPRMCAVIQRHLIAVSQGVAA